MNIAVFGSGYVGLVTGASLANLGHDVICVDIDEEKISRLSQGEIPFFEPGLPELVSKNFAKGKLVFTTDAKKAIDSSQVIFNCVGTPSKADGGANLDYVFSVARTVAEHAQGYKLLVNKSTVPPGTAALCAQQVLEVNSQSEIEVISNPEFLREGSAVYDFSHPDKIVVGAKTSKAYGLMRHVYTGRLRMYIPFIETNWETAEIIKYANNAFLATKISFINEIANICNVAGADVRMVAQAMGLDYRISSKFLNAGVGYGGSCFPKDVRALSHFSKENGHRAKLLDAVHEVNEAQKLVLLSQVISHYGEDLSGKTFSLWGLSFKPKTSDMREAPSLVLIDALLEKGARIVAYDPIASDEARSLLGDKITYAKDIASSLEQSDGILLVTEWDEFRSANFNELGLVMREKVLFDGRNIYEPEFIREDGFVYYGVGRS